MRNIFWAKQFGIFVKKGSTAGLSIKISRFEENSIVTAA
jgi:hypothetical protein